VRELVRRETALAVKEKLAAFRPFPEVDRFVDFFKPDVFLHRRPLLVIIGATNLGKSMLAVDVLRRVGGHLGLSNYKEVTVESDSLLDLSGFDVANDAGVLLDGIGDAMLLHHHRETLQGRVKENRGGRSATMDVLISFHALPPGGRRDHGPECREHGGLFKPPLVVGCEKCDRPAAEGGSFCQPVILRFCLAPVVLVGLESCFLCEKS